MHAPHTPLALIILDGWGYSETTEHNAIHMAHLPFWQQLWQNAPHTFATASGLAVGLPEGQMGNSEVGHLHIGAGRQVLQDLTRVDDAIASGAFYTNAVLTDMVDTVIQQDKALHVLALLSDGGVHSHIAHVKAIVGLAAERGLKKIYLHAFLDGRDTPPQSAKKYLLAMEEQFQTLGCGQIASIIGRYYAMDRDTRWDRTQCAYDLLTQGKAAYQAETALEALEMAYVRGETDEFVAPSSIGQTAHFIEDGDAVVCMNFRSDRVRQLSRAFTDPHFSHFHRSKTPQLSAYVTLTHYAADIPSEVAFSPIFLTHTLGACIAETGQKQLRIAETEKYAHVTFFFNGGEETPYAGEDRILLPSPKVATYDLQPEMSALPLTDRLIEAIHSKKYAFIVCNFANPDMLGHTGDIPATISALETIDGCLARIMTALKEVGGEALITADHGNAECMFDPASHQAHTAHTTNLVPVVYVGRPAVPTTAEGVLYDIAPTVLDLMGLEKPKEMTGRSLFQLKKCNHSPPNKDG
jgi:2,3-bisphosphoglycerate-independent phosphoglycerate mutase